MDNNIPSEDEIEKMESAFRERSRVSGMKLSHNFSPEPIEFEPIQIDLGEEKLKETIKIKQVTIKKKKNDNSAF